MSNFQFSVIVAGTSTDVSRFAGEFEHVFETTTAGITIQAPQVTAIDIFFHRLVIFFIGYFLWSPIEDIAT